MQPAHNTASMITVSRDLDGVYQAAMELFEEHLREQELERMMETARHAANREEIMRSMPVTRSLSEGFYLWAEYLMGLRNSITLGLHVSLSELRADDISGLKVIAAARARFEQLHPPCPNCGLLRRKDATRCHCGHDWVTKKKVVGAR